MEEISIIGRRTGTLYSTKPTKEAEVGSNRFRLYHRGKLEETDDCDLEPGPAENQKLSMVAPSMNTNASMLSRSGMENLLRKSRVLNVDEHGVALQFLIFSAWTQRKVKRMSPIRATHKGAIYDDALGPITVREIPTPEPGPGQLLIKVLFAGVCHSDLHLWNGEIKYKLEKNWVIGHEGLGEVVQIGDGVENFKVGDLAGVHFMKICFTCEFCKRGDEATCVKSRTAKKGGGTFQQYAITTALEATPLPDVSRDLLAKATPALCAGVTVYRAIKETGARAGEWVVITGAGGGLGSMGVQYARALGLRVVAINVAAKEEHCRKLGAEVFVDARSESVVDEVLKATNGGAHGVVNVATAEKPLADSLNYVRTRGTIVFVSLPKDAVVKVPIQLVVYKCFTIKGSLVGTRKDADEAVDFVLRGLVDIPVEIHPLGALQSVFERMEKSEIKGRVVLDPWL